VDAALSFARVKNRGTAMVAGHRVRDIAALTGRTEGTVRWHLKKVFPKAGASRASLT
jgi:DNA-binding NarL/FixJ family response regulator